MLLKNKRLSQVNATGEAEGDAHPTATSARTGGAAGIMDDMEVNSNRDEERTRGVDTCEDGGDGDVSVSCANNADDDGDDDASSTCTINEGDSQHAENDGRNASNFVHGDDNGNSESRGDRAAARRCRPKNALPNHVPDVDDRERPWLWKPPAYLTSEPGRFGEFDDDSEDDNAEMQLFGGTHTGALRQVAKEDGGNVAKVSASAHPVGQVAATAADSAPLPQSSVLTAAVPRGQLSSAPELLPPDSTSSQEGQNSTDRMDETDFVEEVSEIPSDEAAGGKIADQQTKKEIPPANVGHAAAEWQTATGKNSNKRTKKRTKAARKKLWAGLMLEGLRGSAQWPIRREPLMSAEFLADTGVLPKVRLDIKCKNVEDEQMGPFLSRHSRLIRASVVLKRPLVSVFPLKDAAPVQHGGVERHALMRLRPQSLSSSDVRVFYTSNVSQRRGTPARMRARFPFILM